MLNSISKIEKKKHLVLFLLLLAITTLAQEKNKLFSTAISIGEGSIMLNDGKELQGIVKYDDKTGVLSYENGNNSKSFTSKSVLGFEFFDENQNKQRVFYSLPYEDSKTSIQRQLFFEVILDLKTFVILAKTDPIAVKQNQKAVYNPSTSSVIQGSFYNVEEISQIETIYFMDEAGAISPYLEIATKEIDGPLRDRSKQKSKIINRELIRQFTAERYEEVLSYAKTNKLEFDKKDDLLSIMEYFKILVNK